MACSLICHDSAFARVCARHCAVETGLGEDGVARCASLTAQLLVWWTRPLCSFSLAVGMDQLSKLFRKKCSVCNRERNAMSARTGEHDCDRMDDPASDTIVFLPAPLAHYCCRCAQAVGWSLFENSACENCKASTGEALQFAGGDRASLLAAGGVDSRDPVAGEEIENLLLPSGGAEISDEQSSYVQIAYRDEGVDEDAAAEEKTRRLAVVQKECEAIRAAAIEQATKEAEEKVAQILADAQNSARQQAAEEREQLTKEAREQADIIIEEGKAAAKTELERVLCEAEKILSHASSEAATIVEEARTSVAPAGAWVEVGLSGTGGWHRPGMCVFFRGELAAACGNFSDENCVGAGGFGSVFRAQVIGSRVQTRVSAVIAFRLACISVSGYMRAADMSGITSTFRG